MSKIMWLKDTYPVSYQKVVDSISSERKKIQCIQFDERYWNASQIKEFFEDLAYGDNRAFELSILRLPYRRLFHNKAEKRYKQWKQEYDEFVKQQEENSKN